MLEARGNRGRIHNLSDSPSQVSEILHLTACEVRGALLNRSGVQATDVRGKCRGKHGRVILPFTPLPYRRCVGISKLGWIAGPRRCL